MASCRCGRCAMCLQRMKMAQSQNGRFGCKTSCDLRREVSDLRDMVVQQGQQLNRLLSNQSCSMPPDNSTSCGPRSSNGASANNQYQASNTQNACSTNNANNAGCAMSVAAAALNNQCGVGGAGIAPNNQCGMGGATVAANNQCGMGGASVAANNQCGMGGATVAATNQCGTAGANNQFGLNNFGCGGPGNMADNNQYGGMCPIPEYGPQQGTCGGPPRGGMDGRDTCPGKCSGQSTVRLSNVKNIKNLKPDVLYHLGLDTASMDFRKEFGDVKYVVMGSTDESVLSFAKRMMKDLDLPSGNPVNIAKSGNRYAMYKVGPVLCVSHGMGAPSVSAVMNEVIKLVYHANIQDPIFFRIGASGGLNVKPGTVVISEQALDGQLRSAHEVVVRGKAEQRPTTLDAQLAREVADFARPEDGFQTVLGKTMCTNDFYEGQTRTDGAFADYTDNDKINYLQKLKNQGITNIDMESAPFAAFTKQANIRSANVCVANLDRLKGDNINADKEELENWSRRPQRIVSRYIRNQELGPDALISDDEDDVPPSILRNSRKPSCVSSRCSMVPER
ncbi:uridine phosphorylase 1-like [Scaptodrosophila lebanonensis]|uniref:Uridine phosphorylase 1-like n=1 Tax=Drosophila lebanonensis TaxID=7225 RepID=A0A6J2TL73_DROLE|nr:uridine phosphorylase 1-like [Scaptodrosophila lebanonensis]